MLRMGGRPLRREVEPGVGAAQEFFGGFAGFGKKHLVAELREVFSEDHLVGHILEICQAHAAPAPAGAAGKVLGRAHADLADDAEDALAVVVSRDAIQGALPVLVSETERVEQGGGAAGVSGNRQLIRGNGGWIGRHPRFLGAKQGGRDEKCPDAISRQPPHRSPTADHSRVSHRSHHLRFSPGTPR